MIDFTLTGWAGVLGLLGACLRNLRGSLIHKGTQRYPTMPYWTLMGILGFIFGAIGVQIFALESASAEAALIILIGYIGTDLISAIYTIITGKFLFANRKR